MPAPLPSDLPDPRQHAAWRRLPPRDKLALFSRHMYLVRQLKTAGVRAAHPDWPEPRIRAEVARIFLHGQS